MTMSLTSSPAPAPGASAEFTLPQRRHTDRRSSRRWLFSYAIRHPFLWLMLAIGAFSNAALAAAIPVLTGQAFNGILQQPPNMTILARSALLVLGSQLLRAVLQFGRNFGAELLGQRMERDIRDELYASLLGKSMTFHSLQPVGDTMARATNDVREINLMFNPGLNLVIGSAFFLVMPILVAPRYSPSLVIIPAVYLVLYFILLAQYLHELQPITKQVRQAFGSMNTRLAEVLDGIETVKGASQEQAEVTRFVGAARRFRDAFVWQGRVEARFLPLLMLGIAIGLGFLQSLILFRQGQINIGDVVAYFGLLQLLNFPTFVSLTAYSQVSSGLSASDRILDLINRKTELDQNVAGAAPAMTGRIEFRDVDFAYESSQPVIGGVSFVVEPGKTVAIVGQTGAGKTTLARLVNRTYDVAGGQVLIDDIDVRQWNLEALRQQISIIEQDIFLFSRSIAENIAFGKPDASRAEIEAAARAAQAHEFITSFRDGYDTVIGDRGVTLSGGQRQRLALARAFLTDPRILILDDSTSSIDSATEDRIQRAIFAAAKGRTTLIITHRLSQIRWADLVVVLRNGVVDAVGTHESLLRSSPAYSRIFTE